MSNNFFIVSPENASEQAIHANEVLEEFLAAKKERLSVLLDL